MKTTNLIKLEINWQKTQPVSKNWKNEIKNQKNMIEKLLSQEFGKAELRGHLIGSIKMATKIGVRSKMDVIYIRMLCEALEIERKSVV